MKKDVLNASHTPVVSIGATPLFISVVAGSSGADADRCVR